MSNIIEQAEQVYNATIPGVLNRNTMEKEEVKKYMKLYDSIQELYQSKANYLDTQKDILYLGDDIGKKYMGVDRNKIKNKSSVIRRKLQYDQREDISKNVIYSYLIILFGLLSISTVILLIMKPIG